MTWQHNLFLLFLLWGYWGCSSQEPTWHYPQTPEVAHTDTYFGTEVADPYRWVENDDDPRLRPWIAEQNTLSQSYFTQAPFIDSLGAHITSLASYARRSAPTKHGAYYYFYQNDGSQNQSVLYRCNHPDSLAQSTVFLDPNTWSEDGSTSLRVAFSKEGSYAGILISQGGTDLLTAVVLDVATQTYLADTLRNIKFSSALWRGNEGFYYSSYGLEGDLAAVQQTNRSHKLYFHRLGTPQSTDEVIYDNDSQYVWATISEDERYLFIYPAKTTTGNALYYQDLQHPSNGLQVVVEDVTNTHSVIDVTDTHLLLLTNLDAPNQRVVRAPIASPTPPYWEEVIPENDHALTVSTGGGKLFAHYLVDVVKQVVQFNIDGSGREELSLPGLGSVNGFAGEHADTVLYVQFTSFTTPSRWYQYDIARATYTLWFAPEERLDPALYTTRQVFYRSKDSTRVPMFIVHKKGLTLDGSHPTLLYGYGGFNISLGQDFQAARAAWLAAGGVYAQANLRGGGEYGAAWHLQGTTLNKQNVFDDFISAAEYLIEEGYTTSQRLAAHGRSNGGLLTGAVLTQRPDLFQAVIVQVGVLDMLRYHTFTAGAGWAYDYGTSADSEEMFRYLYGYSPLHNIRAAAYPATLILTGDHDDRVVPAHSYKFAATLQAHQQGSAPILLRIDTSAGHGSGKPLQQSLAEWRDLYAFIWESFGLNPYAATP